MREDNFKLTGKLKALVEAFKNADVNNDELEIEGAIQILSWYGWKPVMAQLRIKIDGHFEVTDAEGKFLDRLLEEHANDQEKSILTENEKLDRLVQLSQSDVIEADARQIELIAEALKLDPDISRQPS